MGGQNFIDTSCDIPDCGSDSLFKNVGTDYYLRHYADADV